MARKKPAKKQSDENDREEHHQPRPFWSGVIAFGLVSLPVSLFPANRGRSATLSMVDDEGNRLRRRYFNEKQTRMLNRDDIVRGYAVEKDQYVLVEDEELEALAPEKTREIDLQRFVPLEDINPVYFERGYFLAPDSDATKAYRLLAKALAEKQRAGIATFVMRDREYLIAIISERGILRAETLRFHDEIRSPQQVGLPELKEPGSQLVRKTRQAIRARARKTLDPAILQETQVQALQDLVERKLADRKDVIEEEEPEQDAGEESNVVDLMEVLKQRLQGQASSAGSAGGSGQKRPSGDAPRNLNRDELYEQAKKKRIAGRSKMTKQELLQALRKTG